MKEKCAQIWWGWKYFYLCNPFKKHVALLGLKVEKNAENKHQKNEV